MSSPTVPSSRNGIGIIIYQIAKVRKLGLTSAPVLLSNPHHNQRVLIHRPNSAYAPSKLYSTARVTVLEFKCDHVHSCLEPSSVFLLGRAKVWHDRPGPRLTLSLHLQPQSPCPPCTSSHTSSALPPLCSTHADPPALYPLPTVLFSWLTSSSCKMGDYSRTARTPDFGIKMSSTPHS